MDRFDRLGELPTLDLFHREVGAPVIEYAELVDRDDVGVLKLRPYLDLFDEARHQLVATQRIRVDDLHGEGAVEDRVQDTTDLAHAAFSERSEVAVLPERRELLVR